MSQDLSRLTSPVLNATSDAISPEIDKVDLRDSSDAIAPCAAIMALGTGGEILGAPHARGRSLTGLNLLLDCYHHSEWKRMKLILDSKSQGGQFPSSPKSVFDCELDHRLAMTAGVLATKVGADLSGYEISNVTHPGFFEMIITSGLGN